MNSEEKKFSLYLTALRFLPYKITINLKKLYLDINSVNNRMNITAIYLNEPTELELELLDDIVTNTNAHIPDYFVVAKHELQKDFDPNGKHDFLMFAFHS